ncbi:hypothetical protein T05_13183 [Trichinella murrelli]|uniref:Uncharacterized protein n=1 Tax=Trichinella murrelli TaxID=144512 RepID=A0A0V0SZF9_9BILA|nr:hypothetical protein T05_13183 [Trichinella murrelli]
MKLVPFATRVRMDVKAFPSRPSVPLLITNSQRRNSIFNGLRHQKICLVAADGTEISFSTVLIFFLVTQESWHCDCVEVKAFRRTSTLSGLQSVVNEEAGAEKFSKKIPEGMPWE